MKTKCPKCISARNVRGLLNGNFICDKCKFGFTDKEACY